MTTPQHGPKTARRGLVVFDVDGVIFRGQLMLALARRRSPLALLVTIVQCLFFDFGRISLERLLHDVFARLKGMRTSEVWDVYRGMKLTENAAATVAALKSRGYGVILLTAGVPDPIVKNLARRLGADDGAGTALEERDGALTGHVSGPLARATGKVEYVEALISREGIPWRNVAAVGDDRNNLPLMRKAGTTIGFRPTYSVRREAHCLVEGNDLGEVTPYALGLWDERRDMLLHGPRSWFREILRKAIHMTGAATPFLAARFPAGVTALLLCAMAAYLVSEFCRVNGVTPPFVNWLNHQIMRRGERHGMAVAPLTLALGVLVSLWCLPQPTAFACILLATIGDSAAALIGGRWGRRSWFHNPRKTHAGSTAFLVCALVCAAVYLPLRTAVPLALLATALESLPLRDWDNFVTPVGAGIIVSILT